MLHIFLADDEPVFLKKLAQRIEDCARENKLHVTINSCCGGRGMERSIWERCDIALLDTALDGKKGAGMELARRIRENQPDAVIIFVTDDLQYAPEAYEVPVFRYLLKQNLEERLEQYVVQAAAHLASERKTVSIQSGGQVIDLRLEDILYVESYRHMAHFLTRDRQRYSCYATLQSMEKLLSPAGFLRIHRSYLVNMAHIKKLQCSKATLTGDLDIGVSEKNYVEIKRAYYHWKEAQAWKVL